MQSSGQQGRLGERGRQDESRGGAGCIGAVQKGLPERNVSWGSRLGWAYRGSFFGGMRWARELGG